MIYLFILNLLLLSLFLWQRRILSTLRTNLQEAKTALEHRISELEVAWGKVKVSGKSVCVHCGKLVEQWFYDGYGRVACANCKPEAFADALRHGKVQK